ncbi:hypothetical protein [Alistipes sp.]|uniref:hypothetical protein n=1 Tax=Alistipes sp. TaxID=1872444 RepID=UPI0025C00885|nr:hypothetical protein [Alistipes sp.]
MKNHIILLLLLLVAAPSPAQDYGQWRKKYDQFKEQRQKEYQDFKAKANADFAAYLKQQWKHYDRKSADAAPLPVIPPEPQTLPPQQPSPRPLPEPTTTPDEIREIADQSTPPATRPVTPVYKGRTLALEFFGDSLTIPWSEEMTPRLTSSDEKGFSAVWGVWSSHSDDCVRYLSAYADAHHLNGWGYYQLIKKLSEQAYTDRQNNERIALQAFLLSQLKFKAQVAANEERLVLLLPFKEQVYAVPYLVLDNSKFYIYSYGHNLGSSYRTYDNNFSYADRQLSLAMDGGMDVGLRQRMEVKRWSAILGEPFVAELPIGNIALQLNYPVIDGKVYYRQTVSPQLATQVLSTLRRKISGMNETQQVGYLLNLVQNGFKYATDDEMFGRQKQLFIEESFFYEQNNCKDRVGVFSWLVRELTGLDVVSVSFAATSRSKGVAHITCAVNFRGDVPGDAFNFRGKRYVMCDPTYINAGIGKTMPCYAGDAGEIRALD